jgi:hypothetical protein
MNLGVATLRVAVLRSCFASSSAPFGLPSAVVSAYPVLRLGLGLGLGAGPPYA